MMNWTHDDGGRAYYGFKGTAGDCVTRAIAIATCKPYNEVYNALNGIAATERANKRGKKSSARNGVFKKTYEKYLKSIGWEWTPTMHIGSGCTVHLKADELPKGRLIVSLSKHYAAIIDGTLHDLYDCSRNETRCVYGYWSKP